MNTTRVFVENLKAYNQHYRFIANKGSTRSSKTFSIEQLCFIIMQNSRKPRVITVVSHSFPHLHSGAIRDFENILIEENISPDLVRTKNPYIYTIGKSILEFVGFDKPGKAIGAARDILHINEPNLMPFSICHQLIQRTKETVFLDWNPAFEFWFDTEGYKDRKDCKIIHSTFLDNIQNLSAGQLTDLKDARRKALAEDAAGKRGYWWNWWQVYGLGLDGQLEGVIFQNWQEFEHRPMDVDYYHMFCIDWGGADPTTFTEIFINEDDKDDRRLYVYELLYQPQIRNSEFIELIHEKNPDNKVVVYDCARKDKGFELMASLIMAVKSRKYEGVKLDNIDNLQEFNIYVHKDSLNVKDEFKKYKWAFDPITNKSLGVPEDKNDHTIDPIGYAIEWYRRNIKSL
jgi:phage terminase large subunit